MNEKNLFTIANHRISQVPLEIQFSRTLPRNEGVYMFSTSYTLILLLFNRLLSTVTILVTILIIVNIVTHTIDD